jgi:hypothetical protein
MRGCEGAGKLSFLTLEDAVAIEGGSLELGASLPGLPAGTVADVYATLNFLVTVFLNNLKDRDAGLYIALTRSSGLACRVRQLSDGTPIILVPAGLIGRLRTFCRTLLRFWDKEKHVMMASSPLDKIPEDQWQIPPMLVPLFGQSESGDEFWKHLQELDESLDTDPRFDPDVAELLHLGLVFLMCHEFAHVFFRHFEFLQELRQTKPSDVDRMRRGMELHADSFAGTWATTIFWAQLGNESDIKSVARGILRQSYIVTVIMALFDAQKKFVGLYDRGDYNHPMIRREVFADACRNQVSWEGKEILDLWQDIELQGWKRAVDAFADLNLEAMTGKFGKIDKGKLAYPLQALNYGMGASFPTLGKILDEGNALLKELKEQIAAFEKNLGASGTVLDS